MSLCCFFTTTTSWWEIIVDCAGNFYIMEFFCVFSFFLSTFLPISDRFQEKVLMNWRLKCDFLLEIWRVLKDLLVFHLWNSDGYCLKLLNPPNLWRQLLIRISSFLSKKQSNLQYHCNLFRQHKAQLDENSHSIVNDNKRHRNLISQFKCIKFQTDEPSCWESIATSLPTLFLFISSPVRLYISTSFTFGHAKCAIQFIFYYFLHSLNCNSPF